MNRSDVDELWRARCKLACFRATSVICLVVGSLSDFVLLLLTFFYWLVSVIYLMIVNIKNDSRAEIAAIGRRRVQTEKKNSLSVSD